MSGGDGRPDAATVRARLDERARALAVPAEAPAEEAGRLAVQSLVFRRGAERFAVPLVDVVEVVRDVAVSPLPGAAAPVAGLAGWRGRVLTVVDLNPGAGDGAAQLVALGGARAALAVLADDVEDARPVGAPAAERGTLAPWARGVTGEAIVVLDLAALQQQLG